MGTVYSPFFLFASTNCPSTKRIFANCTQEHNIFFQGCPFYKLESEVAALHFNYGLTLKEARQKACLNGFQQAPLFN